MTGLTSGVHWRGVAGSDRGDSTAKPSLIDPRLEKKYGTDYHLAIRLERIFIRTGSFSTNPGGDDISECDVTLLITHVVNDSLRS